MSIKTRLLGTVALASVLGASAVATAYAEQCCLCFECGDNIDAYGNKVHFDYWNGINPYHGGAMHGQQFGTCREWHSAYSV